MALVGERNGYIHGSYCNHCNGCSGCKNCIGCSICCNHNHTHIVQMKSDSKLGKQQQKEEWQIPLIEEIIILQLKDNLKILMMAGNFLNSFRNASSEENSTLVVL